MVVQTIRTAGGGALEVPDNRETDLLVQGFDFSLAHLQLACKRGPKGFKIRFGASFEANRKAARNYRHMLLSTQVPTS